MPSAEPTPCGFQTVQGAPWDWWDNATYGTTADAYQGVPSGTMGCLALLGNPDMSEDKGLAFADMMSEFFTPRVFAALNADDAIETEILGANDIELFDLSIFPNPAKNEMRISTNIEMNSYDLFDLTGKLIFTRSNIKSNTTSIKRNGLNSGLYLTRITDVNGNSVIRKIIFE